MRVEGYRNLGSQVIEFSDGINCIFGENGSGKTNLLEAIHVLTHHKSFRKNTAFPQMININGEQTNLTVYSLFEWGDKKETVTLKMDREKSLWSVNGKVLKRRQNLLQTLFINPFDSYNFHATAGFRRHWVDEKILSLEKGHRKMLGDYNRFLKIKNHLLTMRPTRYREQIKAVDEQMARVSFLVTQTRREFLGEVNPLFEKIFRKMFSDTSSVELVLDSRLSGLSVSEIFALFRRRAEKDEAVGHMTCGIHRDDYGIFCDGLNTVEFCSLGQQKMALLGLSLAFLGLLERKCRVPIVLIDDVSGELDRTRWRRFVKFLGDSGSQILVTTANESFKAEVEKAHGVRKIFIEDGVCL